MAKRRTSGRAAAKAQPRTPKAKSKKPAPAAEVEVVEEAGGEGIDTGIVVITSIILVVAFVFVDQLRGVFGEGMFFAG